MSERLPEELRKFSRVLMAGEQVLFMERPANKVLVPYELILAAGGFVVIFLFITIFSDLPVALKAAAAAVFSAAAVAVIHFAISTTSYVITDKRLLIVNNINSELKDSCELDEVTGVKRIGFGKQLVVERSSGTPMRLFGLTNRDEAERVLIGS